MKKLMTARNRRKMTQEELAEALSITVNYLYRLEHGNRRPSLSLAIRINELFPEITLRELSEIKYK